MKLHPDFAAEYFDEEVTSKVCSVCNVELDLSYFSPSKNGQGGVKARCRDCCAGAAREYAGSSPGKTARALAQAKFRSRLAAEEHKRNARAAFIASTCKTPAGRALIDAVRSAQKNHRNKISKC